MKYMITKFESYGTEFTNVTTTSDEVSFTSFPAVVGNPNYDQFLVQADLTDEEVHELTPDVWFDFPESTTNEQPPTIEEPAIIEEPVAEEPTIVEGAQ